MMSETCGNCGQVFLKSFTYWGHLNFCGKTKTFQKVGFSKKPSYKPAAIITNGNMYEASPEDYVHESSPIVDVLIDEAVLLFQQAVLLTLQEKEKEMPKVKESSGNFVTGNRRIYNTIMKYTAKRHQLSEQDNTDMMCMIKRISRMNGKEIPLPSRYEMLEMNVCILSSCSNLWLMYFILY